MFASLCITANAAMDPRPLKAKLGLKEAIVEVLTLNELVKEDPVHIPCALTLAVDQSTCCIRSLFIRLHGGIG